MRKKKKKNKKKTPNPKTLRTTKICHVCNHRKSNNSFNLALKVCELCYKKINQSIPSFHEIMIKFEKNLGSNQKEQFLITSINSNDLDLKNFGLQILDIMITYSKNSKYLRKLSRNVYNQMNSTYYINNYPVYYQLADKQTCITCGKEKDLSEFPLHKKTPKNCISCDVITPHQKHVKRSLLKINQFDDNIDKQIPLSNDETHIIYKIMRRTPEELTDKLSVLLNKLGSSELLHHKTTHFVLTESIKHFNPILADEDQIVKYLQMTSSVDEIDDNDDFLLFKKFLTYFDYSLDSMKRGDYEVWQHILLPPEIISILHEKKYQEDHYDPWDLEMSDFTSFLVEIVELIIDDLLQTIQGEDKMTIMKVCFEKIDTSPYYESELIKICKEGLKINSDLTIVKHRTLNRLIYGILQRWPNYYYSWSLERYEF